MTDVILINPSIQDNLRQMNIPMGLMYIGSYLSGNGYDVEIFDVNNLGTQSEIFNIIKSNIDDALCFGLSVMTVQVSNAAEISKFIKQLDQHKPIIWGGVHPTLYPEQVVKENYIDYAVIDEGEKTSLELIRRIEKGKPAEDVKGIAFKSSKKIIVTESSELMDMDELPKIKWELLDDIRKNGLESLVGKTLYEGGIPIQRSRGCPHRCTFCINAVRRIKYRSRKNRVVMEEIEDLIDQDVRSIYFIDENMFGKRKEIKELIDTIETNKLVFKWFSNIRADYFRENYINLSFLKKLKKNGCELLGIGAESGSDVILGKLKKDILVEDTLRSAELMNKCDIKCNFSFMIGLPDESLEEMKKTVTLVENIRRMNSSLFRIAGPQIYRPYPGSLLYNECLKKGMKEPKTLEEWSVSPYLKESITREDFKYYPWINASWNSINGLIDYTEKLIFYTYVKEIDTKFSILNSSLQKIASIRCENSNFKFPIEKYLWDLANSVGMDKILSKQLSAI